MDWFTLFLIIVVVGVLLWGALEVLKVLPMQPAFATAAKVILIVAAILYLIHKLFGARVFPF